MPIIMPGREPLFSARGAYPASLRTELLPADHLSAVLTADNLLAVFRFSGVTAIDPWDPRLLHVGLVSLDGTEQVEAWWAAGSVSKGVRGRIRYAEDGAYLFGHLLVDDEAANSFAKSVEDAYREIVSFLSRSAYPHVCRYWNFLPHINRVDAHLERYRAFCVGRHTALAGPPDLERSLPAASAIGTEVPGLLVSFIASRIPPRQVENPRQVSAFHYPCKHGPRSPLFSRAVRLDWDAQPRLYLSGTASIIGHETVHPGDVAAQLAETLRNIEATRGNTPRFRRANAAAHNEKACLRVYLRHAGHYRAVREELESRLSSQQAVTYLRGDICRADLLVEIEGAFSPGDA